MTPVQRQLLIRAAAAGGAINGRITGGMARHRTIDALVELGYLAEGLRYPDEADRAKVVLKRDKYIKAAGVQLATGNWQEALELLERAGLEQHTLDATAWWMTDAGRRAVADV